MEPRVPVRALLRARLRRAEPARWAKGPPYIWVLVLLFGIGFSVPLWAQEPELPVEEVEAPREVGAVEEEPAATVADAAVPPGPVIERIEVRSDVPVDDPEEIRELLGFAPGERLTERNARQTVRNLQATGAASEVELYVRPLPAVDGEERVEVVLAIWGAVTVESVAIEGDLGKISRNELERSLATAAGQPLFETRLLRDVFRLQEIYEGRGYFQATARLEVDVDDERKRAAIAYRVAAGPRARISRVGFTGDLGPFQPAQLIERLKDAEPGDAYRLQTVRDAGDRLQEWLLGEGYRTAEVGAPERKVSESGEEVALSYPVEVGPRVEVEVIGAKLKDLRKRDLLPFLSEQGYDEALLLQAVDRIREDYQERGHWQVEVDAREERQGDVIRVVIEIVPGPSFTLQEVVFDGNQEVPDEQLATLMEIKPRRLLSLGSGRLVSSTLDDDLDNIRSYYALQGFIGYDVGRPDIRVDGRDLFLTIPIVEGRRRMIVDLAFTGITALDLDDLRAALPVSAGGPYHSLLVEDAIRVIRGRFEEKGHLAAQVSAEERWNEDGSLVDVTFRAIEGPQTVVDRVIVRGNVKTKREVIDKAVGLEPGDPVSPSRLLEVERRLYGLGIFARADVELGPVDFTDAARDVLVRVQEGRTRRVSYGVGYDTDDGFGGLLGYRHSNLFGRAFTFQTDLRYGQRERLARVLLDQPSFTRWNLPMLYSVAVQQEELPAYDVDRVISQVSAIYTDGPWRYGLTFDYRIVNSTLTVPFEDGIIERRDADIKISSLIPNLFVDHRDDPIDPHSGWTSTARFQWAFPLGDLTNAHFLKTFLQQTQYFDLGFGHFAGSARVGLIHPLADATLDLPGARADEPPNLEIPIDERFFAGGDFSHRAYDKDELGIPGMTLFSDGRGRGGNGLLVLNLEYRFPIFGPAEGAAFFDTGNVWADWRDMDPGDLRHGIGLEARYISPIGAVRVGFGYKINPPLPGEQGNFHFYLAVGNPF